MGKNISFIHAADLHLDSPFQGFAKLPEHIFQELKESTFIALENIVNVAIQKDVDFVLLVGDLYDYEYQSLKAQVRLRRAFERLVKHQIKVYLSYGNHDHISGNIHEVAYPEQVYVFPNEKVTQVIYQRKGEALATIQGFSYENRAILTNKANEFTDREEQTSFHIGMLHGNLHGNQAHDPYAPFQIKDLLHTDIDYWALGHIHQRQIVHEDPFIVYPGNTQGRHLYEAGPKGCYYVELTQNGAELSFLPVHAIEFLTLEIDISLCETLHQVEEVIQRSISRLEATNQPILLNVSLLTNQSTHKAWETEGYIDEIIEIVNETNHQGKHWKYIHQMKFQQQNQTDFGYEGDHFIGQLAKRMKEATAQTYLKDLYNHRQGRKFLETLTEEEAERIKKKAYERLMYEMLKNGG